MIPMIIFWKSIIAAMAGSDGIFIMGLPFTSGPVILPCTVWNAVQILR